MRPPLMSLAALAGLAGCTASGAGQTPVGMANPASVHCVKLGGRLEIRSGPGGQTGYCHLPDGRVVEEWQLFRETARPPAR